MGPTFLPLKYHSQYDPRQERATLLSLADLSSGSGSNQTSSYSYLISLGQGDNLPSIDNLLRQHNQEQEVDITTGNKIVSPLTWWTFQDLLSSPDAASVINSVGSLVRTLRNVIYPSSPSTHSLNFMSIILSKQHVMTYRSRGEWQLR